MTASILWRAGEAATATDGQIAGDWRASGVSIDSRTVQAGDLFVAIQGPNFDGHGFVADALARGAAAAMISRRPDNLDPDAPLLLVDDTLAGLQALGRAARARSSARIAAVTGSVGKTGTKEALFLALARSASAHASEGNLNNHWGAPLSLARMPRDCRFGVFELGMNHSGEIAPLSRLVRPHVAIITNVEPVHLEFFNSLSQIADAKAEIFTGLEPDGIAILNRDNTHFAYLEAAAKAAGVGRVISFGAHEDAQARLIGLAQHPNCNCISADIDGQAVTYKVGAPGRHWAINSLAVLAAVRALGADLGLAALAMAEVTAAKGRGQRHRIAFGDEGLLIIDESYNASPIAMTAAIDALGAVEPAPLGRRIAVLGDMLELGETAPDLHGALAPALVAAGIDQVFACGPNMAHLFDALPKSMRGAHAETSAQLLPKVMAAVRPGDTVLVKGSLGLAMAPIVEALRGLGPAVPPANSSANSSAANG
ncbi:MAG: UDP-N-acetylmuramoylalanyl-D-glutamyl-2,6-diaminopimelate--D-alanyl-D-alanine ligase [Rhodospirillaceae bacterium]|jgi:UDP-N-acetylmuramoyl-tripeptide--D-alanyl-D-alanine ligase|nr:UDP-N-acetylmuramoylalanyl-D-glutamyl-2,6-diaminopimelate--D-alanyl-D-alanine ligase [Rhodospirillaceae bacterium]